MTGQFHICAWYSSTVRVMESISATMSDNNDAAGLTFDRQAAYVGEMPGVPSFGATAVNHFHFYGGTYRTTGKVVTGINHGQGEITNDRQFLQQIGAHRVEQIENRATHFTPMRNGRVLDDNLLGFQLTGLTAFPGDNMHHKGQQIFATNHDGFGLPSHKFMNLPSEAGYPGVNQNPKKAQGADSNFQYFMSWERSSSSTMDYTTYQGRTIETTPATLQRMLGMHFDKQRILAVSE